MCVCVCVCVCMYVCVCVCVGVCLYKSQNQDLKTNQYFILLASVVLVPYLVIQYPQQALSDAPVLVVVHQVMCEADLSPVPG